MKGKLPLLLFSLSLVPALFARPTEAPWTMLLSGDADGLLAPCGCTNPQQGGLKRRTTVLRRERNIRTVVLDNGGLSGGNSPQRVLKAEAAAQALDLAEVDAANFAASDARLGGEALSLIRLSGRRLISTSARGDAVPLDPWRVAGPFLVGGATARPDLLGSGLGGTALPPADAAHRLADEAVSRSLVPVMLFDGDLVAAKDLSRAEPRLRLVTYRTMGRPPGTLATLDDCAFATPGENGKAVVRLAWSGEAFALLPTASLGPEVKDDPDAKALYLTYLKRVSAAKLLEKAQVAGGVSPKGFAGSERCASCHAEAGRVWSASDHAHALKTLERVGNHRDPDCVPCHVVGVSRGESEPLMAFRSRVETPHLANVGCESCHGAGAAHAASPWRSALPKLVKDRACLPCHTAENSPEFDFATYWPKIRHGMGGTTPQRL